MKKQSLLLGAALSGLIMASGCSTDTRANAAKTTEVMCHGVNACKGHGQCAGKVDSCSGSNGCDSKISCSGKNSCKGKGLIKMKEKECLEKGGKVAS